VYNSTTKVKIGVGVTDIAKCTIFLPVVVVVIGDAVNAGKHELICGGCLRRPKPSKLSL